MTMRGSAAPLSRRLRGRSLKSLCLFSAAAGLLLGSATPPAPATAPARPVAILARAEVPLAPPPAAPAAPAPAPEPEPLLHAPPPTRIIGEAPKTVEPTARKAQPRKARWEPATGGAVHVLVSIPQQKAYVFRGSELVATSRVSTGKRGHETPTGSFRILQKKVKHRSNRYANAPMPYMQRLTSYGIALHAGHVPGYPASHGCIRLPWGFAKKLYGMTDAATRVTVTRARPRSGREAGNLI
ncbi:MAG TPA: L,D-transpeptidase family protein [Allosphingosinicella sp.]|jgi:lipoprotein-anchoring transpeptidase ErfK/SrfK